MGQNDRRNPPAGNAECRDVASQYVGYIEQVAHDPRLDPISKLNIIRDRAKNWGIRYDYTGNVEVEAQRVEAGVVRKACDVARYN